MKAVYPILFSILIAALLLSCDNPRPTQDSGKTVKIGFIGPMSGADKAVGESGLLGSRIALKLQPSLRNGDKIDILVEDDQHSPEMTEKALKKLVEDDQVSAVMVMSDSQAALAMAQKADSYKTPILVLDATHPDVTDNKYVSQLVFTDATQGMVAALFVIDELLIDHVAVFRDTSQPYSQYLADTFTKKFEEAGGRTELVEVIPGENDHIDRLEKLKDRGVDFFYVPLNVDQILDIGLELRKLGWRPQMMASDGLLSLFVLKYPDYLDVIDGIFATDLFAYDAKLTVFGERIQRIYEKSFGDLGTTFTVLAAEGTAILVAAMDRCGSRLEKDCINSSLRMTRDFEGYQGKISINASGRSERAIYINQIKNEELHSVVKVY